jgi:hypothetical protein
MALLLFGVFASRVDAQIPVTDVAANANLQLINSQLIANNSAQMGQLASTATNVASTASTVANTLTILRAIEDKLLQINAILTTVIYIKNIVAREKEILRMQKEITSNMQKMGRITPEELQVMNNSLLVAVKTTESFILLVNDLLTTSVLRMGDDSRLSQFLSIDHQLAIQQSIMKATYLQYMVIDEERALLGAVRR